jgi:hypothetical protein
MSDDWEDEEYDGTDEGTEDSEHDGDDVFGQESYDPDDLDDDAYEDAIEKVNGEAEAEWLRRGTDPTHPFYDPKKYDIVDFNVDKMFAAWAAEDEEEAEEQAALGENMMLEKMEIARVAREARLLPLPELHEVTFAISKKRKEMKKSLKKGWAVTKRALEPPFLRIVREQREHHERNRELDDNVRAFKKDLGAFVYEVNAMQRKAKGERTNRARKLARNRAKMDLEVTLKSKAKKGVSQGTITKMRQRRAKRRAEAAAKEEAARLEAAQQLAEDLSAQREHNIKMFSQIAKTAGAEAEALELAVIEDRAAMVEEKEAAQEAETALHNHQVRGFHKLGPAPLMATRDDVDRVAALEQGGVEPGWSRHDMADRLLPGGLGAAYAALPNASDDSADVEDDDVGSDDGFDRSEVTRLGRGIGSDAPNVLLAGDATRFAVERSSHDLQALEADLARMERAFGDLQFDQRAAAEEEECVQDRRVRMRNSRSEALEGETVLRKRLRGPPPRMPGDDEKFGSLYRSKKILRLTQLEKSLLKRSAAIARERRGLALQEVRVARDLAQLRERVTAAQRAHAELAAEERSLPMILGNSLSVSIPAGMTVGAAGAVSRLAKLNAATDAAALAPHGTSPTEGAEQELTVVVRVGKGEERGANKTMGAPPSEFRAPALAMEAVLMRSHLVLTTAAANDALELQTGIRKMDRRQWELRESNLQLESEVEHGLSRLAAIKVAMGKNEDDYRRVALVRSIQRFFACGIKLHHVNALLTTDLDWWGGRSKPAQPHPTIGTASSGGGVILRDGNRSGNLEGSIDFPRHSLWAVSFIVTKVDVKAPRQGQRLDHVVFSAGNSQSNVHHVCTVLNRRPAGNPYISHVITHQIRGAALHYRFDWDAASADESIHLVVRVGKCQEQHPIDLEEVCDVGTGKKWYVSSYVKLVRFEMSQGQGRFSLLLEELIRVEEAMREDPKGGAESFMESNILHGHAQLFKVSQLHHELQEALAREGAFQQKLRAAAEKELKAAKGKKARKADRKRQKIIAAKRRYMERKSANNNSVDVETLTEIVGETIEIYRERDRMWRTAVVADFKVSSADGGLSTQTLHLLEFVPNKATESGSPRRLETEVWLNLAIQKFQVMATAVIVLSPEAKRAQEKRERIAWERMERQKEEARVARDTEAARVIEEDETIARLIRDFNAAEKEALEEAPAQAEDDARHLMRLSPGKKSKEQIQVRKELKQAAFFMGQQTLQIAREAGDDDAEVDLLLANEEAREAFIAVKRREARLAEEAEWELRREIHESDIKELRAEQLAGRARRSGGAARQASKAAAATAARIAAERDALRERMRIDMSIWSKAMPTSAAKPIDLVTKKWTTKYAHGEKGRETGEELTTLHKQAAQKSGDVRPYAGYGVGGIRQRFNAYEAERQRVEKEAFDIEQVETAIYETGTLLGVEELRFRHGLAMDESALAITPNARARASESQATKAGSPGANGARRELSKEKEETQLGFPSWARYPQKPRIEEEVYDGHTVQIWAHADPENGKDAFAAEFHAMDPRAYLLQLSVEGQSVLQARVEQLRHRTRFREMMDIAGRVQSFAKRVEELTKTESCYAVLRRSVRSILVQRHRDIEALERDQVNVSNEHDLAEEMLRKRKEAKTASIRAASTLVAVESKYTTTKAAWETAEVDACQATYEAKELEGHVEQTLEWRFEAEKAEAKAHGLLADARAMVNAAEIRQDEAKWPILRWQFKFDDVVDTKFGRGRVVQYRASDEILVVALPWNGHFPFTKKDKKDAKPVFRVYLPVQSVIAREETRQATEHHAMEAAEAETRAWTKMELDAQTRARKGMEEEEVLQRKIKSVESLDLLADEDYQAQMMWAEQMALLDIKMPDRKAELLGIAFTEVTEAWAVRERERLDHRNEMRRQDRAQKMLPLIAEKKERDFKAENARVAAERIVKREAAAKRREEERVAALKQREREEAEFQEMLDTLPPSQRDKVADEHAVFLAEQKEEDDSAVAAIAAEVEAEAAAEAAEILERKRAEKAVRKAELKRKKLEENARRKEKELAKSEGRKAQKTIYEQRPDAPPVIGPWTQYKMRKAAIARMEEELVVAAKAKAADAIVEHWERRREAAREDVAMEEMWQQMLLEVVVEAAAEELALAEEERERAETRVGVVLTDTKAVESRMPYSVYRPLIRMRQSELAELAVLLRALGYEDQAAREERRRTEMIDRQTRARSEWLRRGYTWTYNMEKMETILLEEAEFKRREKKQERIALVTMRREEKATYMFLKEERVLFLQERRRMAEEEAYMRDFMRRWDQLHAASKCVRELRDPLLSLCCPAPRSRSRSLAPCDAHSTAACFLLSFFPPPLRPHPSTGMMWRGWTTRIKALHSRASAGRGSRSAAQSAS